MACFDNVVSLKELCETPDTFSGIYLNDIGVTRQFIEDIITSDSTHITDFLSGKITHALRVVQSAVHAHMGGRINANTLITSHRLGWPLNNTPTSAGGDWKGIQLTLNNYSNFVSLELSQLSLQVNTTGTVPVRVYDLYQNVLLDTINVSAVSGQVVTVYPHKVYQSEGRPLNLFVGYNATGITSVTTTIRQNQCCGIVACTNEYLQAKGVTNTTGHFIDEDCTGIAHTGGVSLVYSLSCDTYSWMCGYARALALPIAYKVASEMYLHGILNAVNSRSSNTVNLNVEQMNQAQAFYEAQYNQLLNNVLHNMVIPSDNACFNCNAPVRSAVIMP